MNVIMNAHRLYPNFNHPLVLLVNLLPPVVSTRVVHLSILDTHPLLVGVGVVSDVVSVGGEAADTGSAYGVNGSKGLVSIRSLVEREERVKGVKMRIKRKCGKWRHEGAIGADNTWQHKKKREETDTAENVPELAPVSHPADAVPVAPTTEVQLPDH